MTSGRFHEPIYALRQVFTLCAELLRLKKASQNLGAERKSLAQSINGFIKSTPDITITIHYLLDFEEQLADRIKSGTGGRTLKSN